MENSQPSYSRHDWRVTVPAVMMLMAALIHFAIIPHHWEHAPAHGIAMGLIGALEVIWAFAYWLRPSRSLAQLGVILATCFISLWVMTRIAPAPFTNEAEEVDFSGVVTKILESLSAAALLAVVVSAAPEKKLRQPAWRTVSTVLLISVLLAAGVYEVARASQPLFPQLSPPGHEDMEHMDDH